MNNCTCGPDEDDDDDDNDDDRDRFMWCSKCKQTVAVADWCYLCNQCKRCCGAWR
jgi:hypothetical protein